MLPLVQLTRPCRGELRVEPRELGAERRHGADPLGAAASRGPSQLVHHRASAAEPVVERRVVVVELVVAIGRAGVGQEPVASRATHRRCRRRHVRVTARGDRGVDRRAHRRRLVGLDHVERTPQHVGVHLHHERVPDEPAGDGQLAHGDARGVERLDDRARPERGRLDERAVDVLGPRVERETDDRAAQLVVDEDRAVAAQPVEGDEAVVARGLLPRERREVVVRVEPPRRRGVAVGGRQQAVDDPGEHVADAALAGLVAEQAGGDASLDDAAHPRHLGERARRS